MADYSKFYEARNLITQILQQDLIGPVKKDEILTEIPTQYYIMGKLYPQGDTDDVEDLARNPVLENEMETYDASVSLSNQSNPSSFGITFTLKSGVSQLKLCTGYAFYRPVPFNDAKAEGIDTSRWDDAENKPRELWRRKEYRTESIIRLSDLKVEPPVQLEKGIALHIYTHTVLPDGARIVTVAMVNTNKSGSKLMEKAALCAFQPELKIMSIDNRPIFLDANQKEQLTTDKELLELQLLYSDTHSYAQGHGCSVTWDLTNPEPLWVSNAWMPSHNLLQMMARQIEDKQILSMKYLAETSSQLTVPALRSFVEQYKEWIDQRKTDIENLAEHLKAGATINLNRCNDTYLRISHSIDLLEKDPVSYRAFQLANEAMLMQRRQTLIKENKAYDPEKVLWYPFQLAFILNELSSFIDPDGEEREVVDLLWFPTGGGKTEAYLGITAFVIFLRRLRNTDDDGVTVIMRYTLRLLTLQQFERASMLICACELLRKQYNLGGTEISTGLWVGGNLTPNHLEDARASINRQVKGAGLKSNESNPVQIQVCPWCGKRLTANNYHVDIEKRRMFIKCSNESCEFGQNTSGLPLHIIDDAIYEHLPTFLVATVDKFAQIPLSDKPASLFGIKDGKNPPELIIQDELHLISGPLGTMTGIYEAAITKLCEHNGRNAKVVASTATIRNAEKQILALYGRKHTQFPPQGLSSKDSYFAVESDPANRPARQYFGVMGVGTTATTTLIRVNAALLFASRYLATLGFEDKVIDNFWTITGYFNSLRELGGASTQIVDDVQSRFNYLAKTKFVELYPGVDVSERYEYHQELTSRMSNTEITKIIQDRLKRSYREGVHSDVYDFILASNMISVGVDVGRLGTMVVAGQPKTNAEYIQATSRVGRDNPGLVITIYNPARSRDRSHYEQFLKYHSALYKYVEATSLTPFADRARDRGLHALYVSLCRYLVPGMLDNDSAADFDPQNADTQKVESIILDYVKKVDPNELEAVIDELQDIEDDWYRAATGSLVYRSHKGEKQLLKPDTDDDRFRTMNSMRSVDAQAGIFLKKE